MIKKTVTYVDYDGNERTEDHFFNLNKAELTELEMSELGGLRARLDKMVRDRNAPAIMATFKDILHRSYGIKSLDGRRFEKRDRDGHEHWDDFVQTEAYSEIFMELCTDAEAAADFVAGVLPKQLGEEARAEFKKNVDALNA